MWRWMLPLALVSQALAQTGPDTAAGRKIAATQEANGTFVRVGLDGQDAPVEWSISFTEVR